MNLEKLKIIKSDERGFMYDCDKLIYILRKKDTISANHTHNDNEILYLVRGEAELTIGNNTKTIKAPIKIEIPGNIYHKLIALTDIEILEDRDFNKNIPIATDIHL